MTPLRAVQLGLWALAALLFVATVYPFVATGPGADDAAPARRAAAPLLVPSVADLALPPLETFAETLKRPVFTATRRPPSPLAALQGQAGAAAPSATPQRTGPNGEKLLLGTYLLNGIVVASDRKIAMLKHLGTGKALRIGEGDTLDNWQVAAITADAIVIRQGDREEKVALGERR